MFGAVNVGLCFSWWDYGQLPLYLQNGLLLTQDTEDAGLMRDFFAIPHGKRVANSCDLGNCEVDLVSVVSATKTSRGRIAGSAIVGCACEEVAANEAILV